MDLCFPPRLAQHCRATSKIKIQRVKRLQQNPHRQECLCHLEPFVERLFTAGLKPGPPTDSEIIAGRYEFADLHY
jgi:hypothetical protein